MMAGRDMTRSTWRRIVLSGVAAAALLVTLLPGGSVLAGSNPRFLTLPFPTIDEMRIQDGWWRGDHDLHRGLDYIKGRLDRGTTWQNYPVIAAADGKACAARNNESGCINGIGKRVVIKHRVTMPDGSRKTYFTYYGHLKSVASNIQVGTDRYEFPVKRGQQIGVAGATGLPGTGIHLHFEILTAPGRWLDPYDIYGYRYAYPHPHNPDSPRPCGPNMFWTQCPPVPPANASSASGGSPEPAPDPVDPDMALDLGERSVPSSGSVPITLRRRQR
jgi:murein DD-endopeptidase MepM/ murein hydrolase activator NlpD